MRALTWLAGLVFFLSVGATTFILVDGETAERLTENWPDLPEDTKGNPGGAEKIVSLVKTNWLFYGTLALFSGFAWAGLVRMRRAPKPYRPRGGRPVERAPAPMVRPEGPAAPAAVAAPGPSAVEEFLTQFEINWKTFASYTQDLLHRKIKELEEGPQRGLREVSEKVSVLGNAIEEVKKDIADVRSEVQGVSRGVTQGVSETIGKALKKAEPERPAPAPVPDAGLRKLEAELRAALEKLSGLDQRGLKLVQVIEDERNDIITKRVAEEAQKIERNWAGRVTTMTGQVNQARKESEGHRAELARAQEANAALKREIEQGAAREEKLRRDLQAAAREEARRNEEAKELAARMDRAKKEIERKEKEFAEERKRLTSKVEELEAQGTVLESEKADAQAEVERLQSVHDADATERERLRVAAETARAAKDRAEAESRRLAEELKTLRSERAQARAREVVAFEDENVRLKRALEGVRRELDSEREARQKLEKDVEHLTLEAASRTSHGDDARRAEALLAAARTELAARAEKQDRLEAELSDLREKLSARGSEVERLKAALDAASTRKGTGEEAEKALQAYRLEIERLELARFDEGRQSRLHEEEAKRFKAKLAELEASSRAREEELAAKIAEAEEKAARWESGAAEAQAAPEDSAGGEPSRLIELEKEKGDLLTSLDRLGGELEKLRGDIDGFRRFQGTLIDGSIPAAIAGVDTNLKVFAWNPAAEALWKVEADAVLGRQLNELSIASLGPDVVSGVERAMSEKQTVVPPQSTAIDGDGKVRHIRWSFDPILGPGDESLGAVLIADDVTEEVEREIEARVQALFSKSLLRSLPAALIVLDAQQRVISWNRGAEDLLGMSESTVVGKEFFSLKIPLAKPAFQRRFEESQKDGAVHRLRVRFDLDGLPGNYVVTQAPFYGGDESVRGSILIIEAAADPVAAK